MTDTLVEPRASHQEDRHFCPVCSQLIDQPLRRVGTGRRARCPHCGCLERHRFLAILLSSIEPMLPAAPRVLEVAPSPYTTPLLRRLEPSALVSLDFDPGADKRTVDVRASLTQAPFPDASLDLVVCFHVLEHIPDDRLAMEQIARILGPDGIGVIQVPWRQGAHTDEDPDASEEERVRRFGQADHVRFYGGDFEDRLRAAGLSVCRVEPRAFLGDGLATWIAADAYPIWLVKARTGGDGWMRMVQRSTGLARAVTSLTKELSSLEADVHARSRHLDAVQDDLRGRSEELSTVQADARARSEELSRMRADLQSQSQELLEVRRRLRRTRRRLRMQRAQILDDVTVTGVVRRRLGALRRRVQAAAPQAGRRIT